MRSQAALFLFLATLVAPHPAVADPQATILTPKHTANMVRLVLSSFDVQWTVSLSGSPLDHYATRIVSQQEVQDALQLGSSTQPAPWQLQQYFASQAPGFAGWEVHPPGQTSMHVESPTPGRVYYLALTAVDQAGGFDGIFDLSRNLLRFKPTTEEQPPLATISSPKPSSSATATVPTTFEVQWSVQASVGTFLDHIASRIVSEHDIQQALGLGSTPPTASDLQTYFGGQAPDFVGWAVQLPDQTGLHVVIIPDGQVYYLALTGVDDNGTYLDTFDLSKNLLRFKPTGPVPTAVRTWGAIRASRR